MKIWPGYESIHHYPYFADVPMTFSGTFLEWIDGFQTEMANLGLGNDNDEWHYVGGGRFRFVDQKTAAIFKLRFR